jgi:hypothetical protein
MIRARLAFQITTRIALFQRSRDAGCAVHICNAVEAVVAEAHERAAVRKMKIRSVVVDRRFGDPYDGIEIIYKYAVEVIAEYAAILHRHLVVKAAALGENSIAAIERTHTVADKDSDGSAHIAKRSHPVGRVADQLDMI